MRSWWYADLTWPELRDAAASGTGVVLPIGSTEQHGPHLAVSCDVDLSSALAHAIAEENDLLVAPPITYGYRSRPLSGGGQTFPGTISVSARTLMAVVEDVLVELMRSGFKRLVLLNWHYENANFIYEAAVLARERSPHADGVRIMVVEAAFAGLSEHAMEVMFEGDFQGWDVEHAAILETSLMLHLCPEKVLFDRAVDDASARHPSYDLVPAPDDFIPASGVLWKATLATAEKGAVVWPEIVAGLAVSVAREL